MFDRIHYIAWAQSYFVGHFLVFGQHLGSYSPLLVLGYFGLCIPYSLYAWEFLWVEVPLVALKYVMWYLTGSLKYGLKYIKETQKKESLEGFMDTDYTSKMDTRKSSSNFVFMLFGMIIGWK